MSTHEDIAREGDDMVSPARQRKAAASVVDVDHHHRHAGNKQSNGILNRQTKSHVDDGDEDSSGQRASIGRQILRVVCFTSFFLVSCSSYV